MEPAPLVGSELVDPWAGGVDDQFRAELQPLVAGQHVAGAHAGDPVPAAEELGRYLEEGRRSYWFVGTGGLASTIVPHCRSVDEIDDFLTLDGLRLIFDMNQEQ